MKVSPLDLRQLRFRAAFRGYDRAEVAALLAEVADDYEFALREVDNLRQEVTKMEALLAQHRDHERDLRNTMITAQRLSDDIRANAEAQAKQVIREARRDGWLNERALAEDIARSATRRQPAGARLIEEKLTRHGVNAGIARKIVAAAAAVQDDRTAAYQLARKRLATMGSVKPQIALRRVAGLLARRGFDQDIVDHAIERVRNLLPEIDESDA